MRLLHIERLQPDMSKDVRAVAIFDMQLSQDVRVYGLRLMRAPDGRHVVYAPSANGGRRVATFSPALAAELAELATNELQGARNRHGTTSRI